MKYIIRCVLLPIYLYKSVTLYIRVIFYGSTSRLSLITRWYTQPKISYLVRCIHQESHRRRLVLGRATMIPSDIASERMYIVCVRVYVRAC